MRCGRRIFKSSKTALKVDRSTLVRKTVKLDFSSLCILTSFWSYNVDNTYRNEKRNAVPQRRTVQYGQPVKLIC